MKLHESRLPLSLSQTVNPAHQVHILPDIMQILLLRMTKHIMSFYMPQAGASFMVRYGHEMNGNWYPWGQQPVEYVASHKFVTAILRNNTCGVAMVWAPNSAEGYPWSGGHSQGVAEWASWWSYCDSTGRMCKKEIPAAIGTISGSVLSKIWIDTGSHRPHTSMIIVMQNEWCRMNKLCSNVDNWCVSL